MRALTAPLVLAAAVGVPYVATNGPDIQEMWDGGSQTAASDSALDDTLAALPSPSVPLRGGAAAAPAATRPTQSISLAEVIRFDVNKGWVFQRWQRKTTSLSELNLFGVRVPLVTGTSLHDLAGSLTYYFDAQGQVQRISLLGSTGNTTQLEMLVTQRYGLQMQGNSIAGRRVYQQRQGDAVTSELVIRPAAVIRTNSPHESFSVDLQLQRPGVSTPLPRKPLPSETLLSQKSEPEKALPSPKPEQQPADKPKADEPETSDEPFWRMYMPRSRVPTEQIDNLERRGRF